MPTFLETTSVKAILAPITNPSPVGLSERYVGLVLTLLKRVLAAEPRGFQRWPDYVVMVEWLLNTRTVRVHGFTPVELFLGQNPRVVTEDFALGGDTV